MVTALENINKTNKKKYIIFFFIFRLVGVDESFVTFTKYLKMVQVCVYWCVIFFGRESFAAVLVVVGGESVVGLWHLGTRFVQDHKFGIDRVQSYVPIR